MLIRSERLVRAGFAHGFSTREGGISEGPYRSLNLARNVGDAIEKVHENQRRFAECVGCAPEHLFEVQQVHGTTVEVVRALDAQSDIQQKNADALFTEVAGLGLAVRTADCVPILVGNRRTGAVLAIHAGWRGVVHGIVPAALAFLADRSSARECIAAIGPHIREDSFEIGSEVADLLSRIDESAVSRRAGRLHGDLARCVRVQLLQSGIRDIDDVGGDTFAEPERFFSHRRDRGVTGRHLSLIVAPR